MAKRFSNIFFIFIIISLFFISTLSPLLAQGRYQDSRFGVQGAIVIFPDEMKEAGIEITREWIDWQEMEPVKGQYNWAPMDKKVKSANQAGIEILGYFVHMPSWAKKEEKDLKPAVSMSKKYLLKKSKKSPVPDKKVTTSDFCEPKDINDFRRFAKAVAERYDGKHGHGEMKYIEILNEVTLPEFFDIKNTDYEPWLINGYEAVKEGNPDAEVLIGGFVNPLDAKEFVDRMLRDYNRYYDIVNFHVYGKDDNLVAKAAGYLKSRMKLYEVAKPVWITETATIIGLDEPDWKNKLAKGVVKRYAIAFREGVEKVFWWPFIGLPTPEEYPGSPNQKHTALAWGLKKYHDFHPRPAYNTYSLMTSKLKNFSSVQKISDTQYEFMVNGKSVYVLWCDSGSCNLPSEIIGEVKVTDYLGNEEIKDASQITLSESPIFVSAEQPPVTQTHKPSCGDGVCDAKEQAKPSLCPQDCKNPVKPVCGDKICQSGEDSKNCPQDCPITSRCGDGICNSTESCSSCSQDCGECAEEESHFGVNSVTSISSRVKSYIRELGDIYVRVDFRDTIGWRIVKPGGGNIPICKSCCVSPSPSCNCTIGDKFYCNMSRENLLSGGLVIDFYNYDIKLLVTVGANRYDDKPPKFLTASYPEGKEDIYREFLRTVVEHPPGISDKVKYWAIENEAQAPMFWSGSAQDYADIVLLANNEIKSHCPDCKVGINLGTPFPNDKWLNAMFGICNSIDFLDLHYPVIEETVLDEWKTNCPGKEIISTESGLPDFSYKGKEGNIISSKWGGTLEKQARDLIKYNTILFSAGYNQIYWFIIDFDWNPKVGDDFWEHAGLLTKEYERKPAFNSYKTMINKVDHFTSITKLAEGQYKYTFSNKDPVYVLWCDSGTCLLPPGLTGEVKVTDYLGNEEIKDASQIIPGESPIFLEER